MSLGSGTIEMEQDGWKEEYNKFMNNHNIEHHLAELIAVAIITSDSINITIKTEKKDAYIHLVWDDKGWDEDDIERFFKKIKCKNKKNIKTISSDGKGARIALANLSDDFEISLYNIEKKKI